MRNGKEIRTAAVTLVLAVGIGFAMQSSETAKERYGAQPEHNQPSSDQVKVAPGESGPALKGASLLPELSDIHLTSASVSRIRAASGFGINADHLVKKVSTTAERQRPLMAVWSRLP